MLVINRLIGEYECKDDILQIYQEECLQLLKEFKKVTIEHVPKFYNGDANQLAQHASEYRLIEGVMTMKLIADDWRKEIIDYLKNSSKKVSRKSDSRQSSMYCWRKIYIIGQLMGFCSNALIKKKQRC